MAYRKALVIGHIALQVYVKEVKNFVREEITGRIQRGLEDPDLKVQSYAEERQKFYKLWSKSEFPFASQSETLMRLVRAIVDDIDVALPRLPQATPPQITRRNFASLVYQMCKPGSKSRVKAPLRSKGSMVHILRVAIDLMIKMSSTKGEREQEQFIVTAFTRILETLKIDNVPWGGVVVEDGHTRRTNKLSIEQWMNLGKASDPKAPTMLDIGPQGKRNLRAIKEAERLVDVDVNSHYTMLDKRWDQIVVYLDKTILPDDWSTTHGSLSGQEEYINATYHWVQMNYNGNKPVHQLALLAGFILAKMVPKVFQEGTVTPAYLQGATDEKKITEGARNLKWTSRSGRKGHSTAEPFLTMFSTLVIALYEPLSPLRQYMETHENALGAVWTSKHGEC
jgi:hypothetical protein